MSPSIVSIWKAKAKELVLTLDQEAFCHGMSIGSEDSYTERSELAANRQQALQDFYTHLEMLI